MERAELVWTRYTKGTDVKNYLLVYLGESEGKTLALIADEVPDNEIATFRTNLPALKTETNQKLGQFIKQNMPVSYRNAYRHFSTQKLQVLRSYGLRAIKTEKEKREDDGLPPEA